MATRKLILGGAASLLLSGAMIAAAPVRAQTSDPAQTYADAQARYQSELQDYNLKQQNYERQRSEYNARAGPTQDAPTRAVARKGAPLGRNARAGADAAVR